MGVETIGRCFVAKQRPFVVPVLYVFMRCTSLDYDHLHVIYLSLRSPSHILYFLCSHLCKEQ
jgi:hypothetical protein